MRCRLRALLASRRCPSIAIESATAGRVTRGSLTGAFTATLIIDSYRRRLQNPLSPESQRSHVAVRAGRIVSVRLDRWLSETLPSGVSIRRIAAFGADWSDRLVEENQRSGTDRTFALNRTAGRARRTDSCGVSRAAAISGRTIHRTGVRRSGGISQIPVSTDPTVTCWRPGMVWSRGFLLWRSGVSSWPVVRHEQSRSSVCCCL